MSEPGNRWEDERPGRPASGGRAWRTARGAALLVIGGLVVAFALNLGKELSDAAERVVRRPETPASPIPAPAPAPQIRSFGEELVIPAGPRGHFLVNAVVDGFEIRFLIDTGASTVMLTPQDARRLGFRPRHDDFSERYSTPSGFMRGAPVTLREVRIGPLVVDDVRATVAERPSGISLLGMSFLRRLEGYEVSGDKLVMRW